MAEPASKAVPSGPLAVRWQGWVLGELRAGATVEAVVTAENAGSATWRAEGDGLVCAAHHWLDLRGNAIVWGERFTPIPGPLAPGEQVELRVPIVAPIPPGRYRLVVDLVADGRSWFAELGNEPLETEVAVAPRVAERRIRVVLAHGPAELVGATEAALAAQPEDVVRDGGAEVVAYLAPGCLPGAEWATRVLDAHAEGYAAVGGSVEPETPLLRGRRLHRELAPWAPGGGRNPRFGYPLLCPTVVSELEVWWTEQVAGLPALVPPPAEPWTFDGRITMRVRR